MGVLPDTGRLEERIRKPDYSRLVKSADCFSGRTAGEFYEFLRKHAESLTDEEIQASMADYLPPDEMPGLAMQIRAAVANLAVGPKKGR